jgi:hypothetical protein
VLKLVGASGHKPGPLGGGTLVRAELAAVIFPPLWPTSRRVFPGLLPTVHSQVQQPIAGSHHLHAAPSGPVGLEHTVAVPQAANQCAESATGKQGVGGIVHRVPWDIPSHEVAVTDAHLVWALAECGVGDVAGMQVGQFANLTVEESTALALAASGMTRVPHVIVDDQLLASLENLQERDRSVWAEKLDGGVHLHYRQKPSSRRDCIPFAGVRLFPNQELVQFRLPGGPVDYSRQRRGIEAFGEMVLITVFIGVSFLHKEYGILKHFPLDEPLGRAARALEGLSVGDALGDHYFVDSLSATIALDLIATRTLPPAPWYYTDDTEMALSLFSTLRHSGTIHQDHLAESLALLDDYYYGWQV